MTAARLLLRAAGCSDDAFGPVSCARSFDFTLTFEQSILSILPSAILLLATPPRLLQLVRRQPIADRRKTLILNATLATVNMALQLALVLLYSTSPNMQTLTSVPSAVLSLIDSMMIICLSYLEAGKSTRPSVVLNTYLLLCLGFEATQARTLWLINRTSIASVQIASLANKTVMLCLESQSKASSLHSPFRDYPPEALSGIMNLSFVWWLNRLFEKGFRKLITTHDLFVLDPVLRSEPVGGLLQAKWEQHALTKQRFALPKAVLACLKWKLLSAVLPRLFMIAFVFGQPFLITSAINYIETPIATSNPSSAYGLIGATFLIYLGISISTVHYKQQLSRIITMFRGSMISLIYNETLILQETVSADSAALTLMSTDVDNIIEFLENIFDVWAGMVEIAIGIWLLERQVGAVCVVPPVVVLACVGGQTLVAKTIGQHQQNWNQAIQARVKNTSHILGSMKSIKVSGFADVLNSNLQDERRRELKTSRPFFTGIVWLNALSDFPAIWSPVITFLVFAIQAHVRGGQSFTTVQGFTALSIITLVTSPATKLLAVLPQIAAAMGCFDRIQLYLQSGKRIDGRLLPSSNFSTTLSSPLPNEKGAQDDSSLLSPFSRPAVVVDFANATIFPAPGAKTAAISNATFAIPKGSFTALVGPIGSGKTTLLKAILGEMPCASGTVTVQSKSISYCSQLSFTFNGSVKENVCGPKDHDIDEEWYATVMTACDLDEDVKMWLDGDETVVGSKGLKLSGGQKQRLTLARAVFARRDLILLDDTTSALDEETQRAISDRLLSKNGLLQRLGTTVLLTTHSTRYLHLADQIVAIDQGGNLTVRPSQEGGLSKEPSHNQSLVPVTEVDKEKGHVDESNGEEPMLITSEKTAPDGTMMDLTRRTGDFKIYLYYFQTIGWPLCIAFLVANVAAAFTNNFPVVWLKWWAAAGGAELSKYLPVYAVLAFTATASASACIWIVFLCIMPKSAAKLHEQLLDSVMSAPLSFFASTDTGITLNRFSQDMSLVDLALPIAFLSCVMACFDCIAKVALIATGSSYMAITIPFTIMAVYCIQHVYLKTSRQLRYLDLENKSPLYSHFVETMEGLATIRAFGWEREVIAKQTANLDHSQKPYYMLLCVQRWLNLVLDLIITALAVIVVALAVNLRATSSAGLLGIALNNILSFNKSLSSLVTTWTSLETSLGAIARVKAFTATTPSENRPGEDQLPPPKWPANGAVELRDVSVEYERGGQALKNVSMEIAPGDRIGVCGRTGSGKSTLILALLRLVSPSTGTISIDGVDISTLRPNTIRQGLLAVPQDSMALNGTVRSQMDPLNISSDAEITAALQKVHVWTVIESRGGLNATLLDQPLSHGEQQLLGLARALLRRSKVVILDEATSSLDPETDALVQRVLREELAGCTVISVAHRLDTILSFDKIAVLDRGRLVEFDSPEVLLASDGVFRQLHQSEQA